MKNYMFVLVLLLSLKGFSQTSTPSIPPFIEVSGSSEIIVEPDIYFINLRIFGDAFYGTSAQDKRVENELVRLGIKLSDFSLTPISYDIRSAYGQPNDKLHYHEYVLRIQTEKKLLDIFKALSSAGVEQLFVSDVDYTNKTAVVKELGIAALRNASDKASLTVGSINRTTFQILSIIEEPSVPQIFINRLPPLNNNMQWQNDNYVQDRSAFLRNKISIQYKVSYRVQYRIQ